MTHVFMVLQLNVLKSSGHFRALTRNPLVWMSMRQ